MLMRWWIAIVLLHVPLWASAQVGGVGGVWIDAEGILRTASPKSKGKVVEPELPEALARPSDLREISLRSVGEAIASRLLSSEPIPPELEQAAGISRIDYIIFDHESRDVRIAGPAEGWKVLPDGRAVGKTTGRSIVKLEDLATAMRSVWGGTRDLRCSIDPTRAGLAAVQKVTSTSERNASKIRDAYREALGRQIVTTGGVPPGSRFARVMVEADYLMKQMGVGAIKVKGITSHIESQVERSKAGDFTHTLARWWFVSDYEPMRVNGARTVFEIRGARLQLLSEEMMLAQTGERRGTGEPSRDQFAEDFTSHIEELKAKYPPFSDLANLYDLVLVAALIEQEGFVEDFASTIWRDQNRWPTPTGVVPIEAEPVAACDVGKGKNPSGQRTILFSVSFGGVSIRPSDMLAGVAPRPAGPVAARETASPALDKLAPKPASAVESKRELATLWWKDLSRPAETPPAPAK